ncbi:MAG: SCO family protein [Ignavibacteriales bacterium]|nr:SCO family protein [Ignavibacteriota bacterium]MCB9250538.1 SCO family protein [Ignavibacteriales bacterium]
MRFSIKNIFYLILVLCVFSFRIVAENDDHVTVGIDEKLGAHFSGDLVFTNSTGQKVKLSEVLTKPTLLAFVYYECPGICNNTLTELAWVVDRVDLEPGEDFQVLTISIDHDESYELAAKSKNDYVTSLKRKFPKDAWTFLVADSLTVKKVTSEAGFYFKKVGDEYRHAGALITVSPERKISRYIFGSQYNQFDVKMALLDAKAGKTNPTVAKLLQFCFSYDPEGRSYSLNITRIVGTIMLISVGIFFAFLVLKKKKKN